MRSRGNHEADTEELTTRGVGSVRERWRRRSGTSRPTPCRPVRGEVPWRLLSLARLAHPDIEA